MRFPAEGHGPYRLLRGACRSAVERFEASLEDPVAAQDSRLAALLRETSDTELGRELGLRPGMDREAFRASVPIRTHAELLPWLDRVAAGEPGVLTRSPVQMLLETSGTTGRPKRVPSTAPWAASVAEAQQLWVLGMLREDEQLAQGRAFSIVSSAAHARSPGGLPVGANTGRMFLAQPWWVRWRAPVPYAAYCVEDPELRAYVVLRHALAADVRSWTTANPSTILLYARRMAAWWEELSGDCADGTLRRGPAAALSASERRALGRLGGWAGFARRALPAEPRPAKAWNLRRVSCWKGGSAPFFLARLAEALGAEVPVREAGITASEGYFAVPVDDEGPVAWLGGHLLEFIDESGQPRWAWELKPGQEYRLVVSTEAGLLRYDMGDVVRCEGWLGRSPRLSFVRKAGNVLNATGEKVTEDQLVAAARVAFPGAVGFSCALGWAERPWIRVALEASPEVAPRALASFEAALREANVEYAAKRESDRLGPPELVPVPPGTFAAWRLARVRAGAPDAQVKDPLVLDAARWDALVKGEVA